MTGDLTSTEEVATRPIFATGKVLWKAILLALRARPTQIALISVFVLMAWGTHGGLDLARLLWPSVWGGPGHHLPGKLISGLPWDQEFVAFAAGVALLVVLPVSIIKLGWKEPLSAYGLGLPPPGRRAFAAWSFLLVVAVLAGPFYFGATQDAGMKSVYPFYRDFRGAGDFALYELAYLLFFVAIEFLFRGFLLFGLAPYTDGPSAPGAPAPFPMKALLIQILPYVVWHLGKPVPELWGTPLWGIGAGALAYSSRSIWPMLFAHWVLNVWIDAASLGYV